MPTKQELQDHARKLYNDLDPRMPQGISANDQWKYAQALAMVDLGMPDDEEEVRTYIKGPGPEPVGPAQNVKEEEDCAEESPKGFLETVKAYLPEVKKYAYLFAIVGMVGLVWYAWQFREDFDTTPARYRPARARMEREIDAARARYEAAKACQDLRVLSGKQSCEIR